MANATTAPAPESISSPPTDPTFDVSLISTTSSPPPTVTPPSPPATATESSPPKSSLTPPPVSSPPPEPSPSPPPPPPEPSTSPPPPPQPSASPPPPPEPSESPPPPPSEPSESPPQPDKQSKSPPPDQPSLSSSPPPPDSVSPSPPEDDHQGASPGPPSPSTIPVTPSPPQPTNSPFSEQTPPPPSSVTSLPSPSNKSPSSSSSSSSKPNVPSAPSSSNSENTGLIIALTFTCIIILAMAIIGVICCLRRKKRKPYTNTTHAGGNYNGVNTMGTPPAGYPPSNSHLGSANGYSSDYSGGPQQHTPVPMSPNMSLGVNKFSYEELAAATGGFSQGNVIGQGGFGFVHKGILPNGKEVAVKSLKAGSGQGEREFQAEVDIISRVHHRHLVSLVGYCIDGGQRILVYEFVPNKTLEYHLHERSGQASMSWGTRLKIALGSAKGLAYLHEDCHPRIIHRDIKTANILIDYNFEAMVADFGLAKLSADNNTHVSTRVMGTFGYLAPEYASSGKLSEKSDVFSFGVMLLELITGRRPLDHTGQIMEDTLVDWARPLLGKAQETGNYNEVADPLMEGNYNHNEMSHMVACASASISHSARRRPKMSQIVRSLEGDLSIEALNDSKSGQGDSSAYDTGAYNADMTKFRQMVMSSEEFNSSECSDTSEYRLNTSKNSSES